jgi:chitin disaccharide deacetylase
MALRTLSPRPEAFALVADDFGMSEGVSRAILDLVARGRLMGTGVMANMPWAAPLAAELKAAAGTAEIGLHLTLTLGRALGPMPLSAASGDFPAFGPLARRALSGGLSGTASRRELEAEIGRQVDAFADAFGAWPAYVDGHQHVHVLPGIRAALFAAIAARPGWRPWLRDPGDSPGAILARGVAVTKALVIAGLALGFRRAAGRVGLATNLGFSGVSPFDADRPFGVDFGRFLTAPGQRHLVMCHPGHVDDDLRRLDPVVETREQEWRFLASDEFSRALEEAHLALRPLGAV